MTLFTTCIVLLLTAYHCIFLPSTILEFLWGDFHNGIQEYHAYLQSASTEFIDGGCRCGILRIRGPMSFHETHLIKLLEQFLPKRVIQIVSTNLCFYGSKKILFDLQAFVSQNHPSIAHTYRPIFYLVIA